ncbi:putative ATP-binding protein [Vibrio chagasii]|nr:putative ATP-binding protein [Vibrio chagasii]
MLENIKQGVIRRPLKTFLYGAEGVGKSTFCAVPGTAWICAEDGVSALDVTRLDSPESWGDLLSQLRAYIDEPHNYWAVVVDSLDWCERLATLAVEQSEGKSVGQIAYGKGQVMVADKMSVLLSMLNELVKKRGIDVYLIAHASIVQFDDPSGEAYSRWSPSLSKRSLPMFKEWCDCLLFIQDDSYLTTVGSGFKERKIAKGNGGRNMFTEHRPAHDAKNRFKLPFKMPLCHSTYRQAIDHFYQSIGA